MSVLRVTNSKIFSTSFIRQLSNNRRIDTVREWFPTYPCVKAQCTNINIQNKYYNYNQSIPRYYCTVPNENNSPNGWDKIKNIYKERKTTVILSIFLLTGTVIYSGFMLNNKIKRNKDDKETSKKDKELNKIRKVPELSDSIPSHVPYLLIGGGTASFSAFRAIKSNDPFAKVLVISNETNYPYMRPPLSKEIWLTDDRQLRQSLKFKQWNGSERSLFYEPEDFYVKCENLSTITNGGVAVALGWNITKVDAANRVVYLDDGKSITYDKCLIATGAKPRNLNIFDQASKEIKAKISLFRTIHDFENLEHICDKAESIVVVGGGFLGSEISCALARFGKTKSLKVTQIFKEKGNMSKILPEYLSDWTTTKITAEGVNVLNNVAITDVELTAQNKKLKLRLNNGAHIETDHVIVATGVKPNTELAETSDLEVDPNLDGFVVNAELEARSNLYVAGDCACFYDVKLGRRRIEHHDHAVVSGRLAGENMTGAHKPYTHQSMFWSDLGPEIGYEAIGIIDSSLKTYSVFTKNSTNSTSNNDNNNKKLIKDTNNKSDLFNNNNDESDFSKGLVFYLKDNIVVGIVLWNVFNRMSIARQIIKEHKEFDDLNELAKLFNIYDDE